MTRKRSATDRAYLTGFVLGYCLGLHETRGELVAVRNDIETRVEDAIDQARAESAKVIARQRHEWAIPEFEDSDWRPATKQ